MRIGVDLGGSKIEIAALDGSGSFVLRERVKTPNDYTATIRTIRELALSVETRTGTRATVGVGIPGAISPQTGLVKNANSAWLIGKPFDRDLAASLERPVRVANDANCFTLSEAVDGAGVGKNVVFGIIIGTGTGGGIAVGGNILTGPHAIAGEWGHNPLPWPTDEERPGPACYCGKHGCVETFLSGPGLIHDYKHLAGRERSPLEIAQAAEIGDAPAKSAMERYYDRFARSLASVIDILDPDVVVLGGGLSNIDPLYRELPSRLSAYVFSDVCKTPVLKNVHGDSGGVRGAAWLWPASS